MQYSSSFSHIIDAVVDDDDTDDDDDDLIQMCVHKTEFYTWWLRCYCCCCCCINAKYICVFYIRTAAAAAPEWILKLQKGSSIILQFMLRTIFKLICKWKITNTNTLTTIWAKNGKKENNCYFKWTEFSFVAAAAAAATVGKT